MLKKTTVIFVLIFTLIAACLFQGCSRKPQSSGSSAPGGASGSGESPVTGGAGSDSQNPAPGGATSDTGHGKHSGAAIPDTDESAVSDWGTAPGKTAGGEVPGSAEKETSGSADYSEVLVDRDDLFFAVKEVKDDASYGYTWKIYVENRTDKNLMFSFEKVSVNGVMCDPFWAEVVTAGRKGNADVTWMRDAFEARGIQDVYEVNFILNVYNDDDYTEIPLMHDPFTVFPLGEEKALESVKADSEARAALFGGENKVLVDNDTCSIIATGFEPDNVWGYAMHVYLQNKSGDDLVFSAENASLNGIMCDPYWAEVVVAGKSAVSTILWDKSALTENGITQVSEISLPLKVYSDKNIAEPYVDETIELNP